MSPSIYFAKVPIRNSVLGVRSRFSKPNAETNLLHTFGINVVLDVGANKGQYARALKFNGYSGRIVSFEPLPDAFEYLARNRWGFSSWRVEQFALGDEDTTAMLNIAGNSQSSSFQPMHANHVQAAPESAYVGQCEVKVRRLDSIFDEYCQSDDRVFLKIDVQGHEQQVLQGSEGCLDSIVGVELELSLVDLYEGQLSWQDAVTLMDDLGLQLAGLTSGFEDPRTGVMLQANGIFIRRSAMQGLNRPE